MSAWPLAKLVKKPCERCSAMMECTASRKVCSACRRIAEAEFRKKARADKNHNKERESV